MEVLLAKSLNKGGMKVSAETVNQAYLFLIFILNGFFIGVTFDIFRILRKSFDTPNFITYIEDILFWVISAFIVMYSLFIFNNGQFRAYIFIGIFLGITTYMLFFSKLFINISVRIISFIKKIISIIFKIISYPINILYKFTINILIKPICNCSTKFNKLLAKFIKKFYNNIEKDKKRKILKNKEGF